jgi:hypothetical protein
MIGTNAPVVRVVGSGNIACTPVDAAAPST